MAFYGQYGSADKQHLDRSQWTRQGPGDFGITESYADKQAPWAEILVRYPRSKRCLYQSLRESRFYIGRQRRKSVLDGNQIAGTSSDEGLRDSARSGGV